MPTLKKLSRQSTPIHIRAFARRLYECGQLSVEEFIIDLARGRPFAQAPFRYQAKCYRGLRSAYAALAPQARERVKPLLEETGCLAYLA